VSVLDDPRETMGAALKYLGYSLNEASLDALQEAADLIAAPRQHHHLRQRSVRQALVTGEVAVAHGYSGNMLVAIWEADDPDNFEYIVPEEGGTLWVDNMAVPVGFGAPCTAHAFIDFLLDAENGAALTNWTYYASPNEAAEAFIDPEILEDETIYPSDELRSGSRSSPTPATSRSTSRTTSPRRRTESRTVGRRAGLSPGRVPISASQEP
jgi:spermidine/putrescine-binding protein